MRLKIETERNRIVWEFERNPYRISFLVFFAVLSIAGVFMIAQGAGRYVNGFIYAAVGILFAWKSLRQSAHGYFLIDNDHVEIFTGRPDIWFGLDEFISGLRESLAGKRAFGGPAILPFFFPRTRHLRFGMEQALVTKVVPYGLVDAIYIEAGGKPCYILEGVERLELENLAGKINALIKEHPGDRSGI